MTAPNDALAAIQRARDEVAKLCEGKRRWTMSVPARPNEDSDLIIADALDAGEKAVTALAAAQAERDERTAELISAHKALAEAEHDIEFTEAATAAAQADALRLRELLRKVDAWRGLDGDGITDPLRMEVLAALAATDTGALRGLVARAVAEGMALQRKPVSERTWPREAQDAGKDERAIVDRILAEKGAET